MNRWYFAGKSSSASGWFLSHVILIGVTHPCALLLLARLIRDVGDPVHGLVEFRAGVPPLAHIATPRAAVRPANL